MKLVIKSIEEIIVIQKIAQDYMVTIAMVSTSFHSEQRS